MYTIPFEWLATATEDLKAPLIIRQLIITNVDRRRCIEHCWGLSNGEFDENSCMNTIKLRPSMSELFTDWALVPTEDTLNAMLRLQEYNLSCPIDQRRRYDEEFPEREYQYLFVPVEEMPSLIIAPPGYDPMPLTISPGQYPIVTSSTNPFYLCIHAARGISLSDIVPTANLSWVKTLFAFTETSRQPPSASFLSTPRFFPHGHWNSVDSDDGEDDSSELSTPDDGDGDYAQFESWATECASQSNCTDALALPMDEDLDETSFIHTVQRPPAWRSDSVKGSQWVSHLQLVNTAS